jgi:hypothetical protein
MSYSNRAWKRLRTPVCLVAAGLCLALSTTAESIPEPRFTAKNELIRPEGYRERVFVGASLGMSYDEESGQQSHSRFHNVYLHPDAYEHFKKTGGFPEKTILAMEVFTPGSQASINRQGSFEDRSVGLEAAVKDSSRFDESWAYFSFSESESKLAPTAAAFAKDRCWSCHDEHAANGNVFTQFYPVLRKAP